MRVAGGGAVGDHGDGLAGGVAGPVIDLHIEDGGKAAQPLRADAERIDLVEDLDAQRLDVGLGPARLQLGHVDRLHQAFLGQQGGMFGRAADADAQHARRAPAGAHLRQHLDHPIDDRIAGVHHLELGLVLAAAALGRHVNGDLAARHQIDMQHARGVVPGVAAGEGGVGEHAGAQLVLGIEVGAAHTVIHHVL